MDMKFEEIKQLIMGMPRTDDEYGITAGDTNESRSASIPEVQTYSQFPSNVNFTTIPTNPYPHTTTVYTSSVTGPQTQFTNSYTQPFIPQFVPNHTVPQAHFPATTQIPTSLNTNNNNQTFTPPFDPFIYQSHTPLPFNLTYHTTLSSGQPYYAIDMEECSKIASLSGDLRSAYMLLDEMSERDVNEVKKYVKLPCENDQSSSNQCSEDLVRDMFLFPESTSEDNEGGDIRGKTLEIRNSLKEVDEKGDNELNEEENSGMDASEVRADQIRTEDDRAISAKKFDLKGEDNEGEELLSDEDVDEVDYLYSQSLPVIHRDLKCDNMLVNGNHGEVIIGVPVPVEGAEKSFTQCELKKLIDCLRNSANSDSIKNLLELTILESCLNCAKEADERFIMPEMIGVLRHAESVMPEADVGCCTIMEFVADRKLSRDCSFFNQFEEACATMQEAEVSINELLKANQTRQSASAISLFKKFDKNKDLTPDEVTMVSVISACGHLGELKAGRWVVNTLVHKQIRLSILGCNFLIFMCSKCGSIKDAKIIFKEMETRDVISHNIPITGYPAYRHGIEAVNVMYKMIDEGIKPDCLSYIEALASDPTNDEKEEEAFDIFWKMRSEGIAPDIWSLVSILSACSHILSCEKGIQMHFYLIKYGLKISLFDGSSLVDLYARCGGIISAPQVLGEIISKKDVIPWKSIIVRIVKNGHAENALRSSFETNKANKEHDEVTFSGVFNACSHAGWVDTRTNYHRIKPQVDHCACMVGLLGQCSLLKKMKALIENLEFENEPMIWAACLGSCKIYWNIMLEKLAAKILMKFGPQSSFPDILLLIIYVASGHWDEVNVVRREMEEKQVRKFSGCSWIVWGKKTNLFTANEKCLLDLGEIHVFLKDWTALTEDDYYVADLIMILFLIIFSCRSSVVHEKAILAISSLAYATGQEFVKYMQEFYKNLAMSRQNFEEYHMMQEASEMHAILDNRDEKMMEYDIRLKCNISETYSGLSKKHQGLSMYRKEAPVEVLQRHIVKNGNMYIIHWLIPWLHSIQGYSSWQGAATN